MKENEENERLHEGVEQALDAVLATYASAEPRAGLEERVLANLRTVESRASDREWWNWRLATVLAAMLILAAALAWKSSRPAHPPVAVHPSVPNRPIAEAANHEGSSRPVQQKSVRPKVRRAPPETVAVNPKLDVFPSPLPLSEQEKILASYIARYPEYSALVAEARMDALRQEDEVRRTIVSEQNQQ